MHSENLFTNYSQIENNAPLADKLRPKNLEDFFGQQLILNDNSLLRSAILNDKISNFIFSGPPGVGKTTLIEIISFNTRSKLIKLNAVLSSVKELRNEIANAKDRLINSKRKTILFIDEVHRFTSVQQDALLPSIENGTITFIGATTENPFFAVNKALVSRSRIFTLLPLAENDLQKIIQKVITHYSKQKDSKKVYLTQDAISHLIKFSGGDARTLINALEMAIETTAANDAEEADEALQIIEQRVCDINDLNVQIATSAEEQSVVADEINRNVLDISDSCTTTTKAVEQTVDASEHLMQLSQNLAVLVKQFKV